MLSNPQNHPAVEAHKSDVRARAAGFAEKRKRAGQNKNVILRNLMANYGLKIREARAIYRAA